MKNWILRASTAVFAAGLMGSLACGGSSSSCGGSNINANSSPSVPSLQCGAGTYLNNNRCVPMPTATPTGNATPAEKIITR
jgi:hypothetical protein